MEFHLRKRRERFRYLEEVHLIGFILLIFYVTMQLT